MNNQSTRLINKNEELSQVKLKKPIESMRFLVEGLNSYMWFTHEKRDKSILNLCVPISQIRIKLG